MADTNNVVRYSWENLSQEEGQTDGTVAAGHLLEDGANGFAPHGTDAGVLDRVMFAKDMRGRGYEAGDEYPGGEWISSVIANAGVGITAILAAGTDLATAANANITEGDRLVSAGDGSLRKFDADGDAAVVAVAEEDVDNSGAAAGETALLEIEVTR